MTRFFVYEINRTHHDGGVWSYAKKQSTANVQRRGCLNNGMRGEKLDDQSVQPELALSFRRLCKPLWNAETVGAYTTSSGSKL